jgi:hypothetical protein
VKAGGECHRRPRSPLLDPRKASRQYHPHRDQAALEGVEDKTKTFKRGGAQQRLVIFLAKDHRCGTALTLELEVRVADRAAYSRAIGKAEVHSPIWLETQLPQQSARHEAETLSRLP